MVVSIKIKRDTATPLLDKIQRRLADPRPRMVSIARDWARRVSDQFKTGKGWAGLSPEYLQRKLKWKGSTGAFYPRAMSLTGSLYDRLSSPVVMKDKVRITACGGGVWALAARPLEVLEHPPTEEWAKMGVNQILR